MSKRKLRLKGHTFANQQDVDEATERVPDRGMEEMREALQKGLDFLKDIPEPERFVICTTVLDTMEKLSNDPRVRDVIKLWHQRAASNTRSFETRKGEN